jgi:hypothetical protein
VVKLKNGWRRWTAPSTIKKKQDHCVRPQAGRSNLARSPDRDWEQPEGRETRASKRRKKKIKERIRRLRKMGEAKDIVGGKEGKVLDLTKKRESISSEEGGVIGRLTGVIEDLDHAIEVKQHDLGVEGTAQAPENHYKLGVLRAADSLIRRARALLEDYGTDLVHDLDPTVDVEAAKGEDFETKDEEKLKRWAEAECENLHSFDDQGLCRNCGYHLDEEEQSDPDPDDDEDDGSKSIF